MTEVWDVIVQKKSAFLQGWSVEFTFGEELLMEHALPHHSQKGCTCRTGWPTQVLPPTRRMQSRKHAPQGKAGEGRSFIAPSFSEGS